MYIVSSHSLLNAFCNMTLPEILYGVVRTYGGALLIFGAHVVLERTAWTYTRRLVVKYGDC